MPRSGRTRAGVPGATGWRAPTRTRGSTRSTSRSAITAGSYRRRWSSPTRCESGIREVIGLDVGEVVGAASGSSACAAGSAAAWAVCGWRSGRDWREGLKQAVARVLGCRAALRRCSARGHGHALSARSTRAGRCRAGRVPGRERTGGEGTRGQLFLSGSPTSRRRSASCSRPQRRT